MGTFPQERPPGFLAALLAASGAHVLALILVGVAAVPLTLVTSTAIVLAPEPSAGLRLLLPWLLVLAVEPFLAAWIAKGGLALFDAGRVTYPRALGAMALARRDRGVGVRVARRGRGFRARLCVDGSAGGRSRPRGSATFGFGKQLTSSSERAVPRRA